MRAPGTVLSYYVKQDRTSEQEAGELKRKQLEAGNTESHYKFHASST